MTDVRLDDILDGTLEWDTIGEVVRVHHTSRVQGVSISSTLPAAGQVLVATTNTTAEWGSPPGDVTGPSSSTVGHLPSWDATDGGSLVDSGIAASDVILEGDPRLTDVRTPSAHASTHENGGSDEISVAGLSGVLADAQIPQSHATSHRHGGSDEISTASPTANSIPKAGATGKLDSGWLSTGTGATDLILGGDARLADARTPTSHVSSHQNGGSDELDVTGLSGLLGDPQTPAAHKTTHQNGGADELDVTGLSGLLLDPQTPVSHKTTHQNGGADELDVTGLTGVLADPQVASGLQSLTTVVTTVGALAPTSGQVLKATSSTTATWQTISAGGDTTGAASSVAGNVVSFADTTGKALADSGVLASSLVTTSNPALTDARTPTSHHSSHMNGGSDEISTTTPGADQIPKADGSGKLAYGWLPVGTSASTLCAGDDSRLTSPRTADAIATSGTSVTLSSTAPTPGQILRASSATSGSWQSALLLTDWTTAWVHSPLQTGTTASITNSSRAYWVYVGILNHTLPATCYVNLWQTSAGAGTQVAEVCLATTPSAPSRANQTVTVRVANNSLTSLTVANQIKRNTSAMNGSVIAVGSHLWMGFRPQMATTQPTIAPWLINDMGQGLTLTTNSAAAFATNSTYTGVVTAASLNGIVCPSMFLSFV